MPAYIERLLKRWKGQPGGMEMPGVVHHAPNTRGIDADWYGDPMAEPEPPDFLREVNEGWQSITRFKR